MKTSAGGKDGTWYLALILLGLATRVPHLVYLAGNSTESQLTYLPTIASSRFLECARAFFDTGLGGDAFSYASPFYVVVLALFFLAGAGEMAVFVFQSLAGILTGLLIFRISQTVPGQRTRITGSAAAAAWYLYAPAAFYETTLLPLSLICLLVCLWYLLEVRSTDGATSCPFLSGFICGALTGLRPPLLLLAPATLFRLLRERRFGGAAVFSAGLVLPLLVLSFYHHHQGGGFSPLASSTGINLVLGHAESCTGYGPHVVEYGLVEVPGEDIHQVSARIAADSGYTTPAGINRFWTGKALEWIRSNPAGEAELWGRKTGGLFGLRPFDTFFDLPRDISSDPSLRHLVLPRWVLSLLIAFGGSFLLISKTGERLALLPMGAVILSTLMFTHGERYWLPAVPLTLAVSVPAFVLFGKALFHLKSEALAALGLALLLMIPALIWPVPEAVEGSWLYNRGVKAYNAGMPVLALNLFDSAAEVSPEGSSIRAYSLMQAFQTASGLGMSGRAAEYSNALMEMSPEQAP